MRTLLDLRGLLLHSLHAGTDPEGTTTTAGAKLNTVGYGLEQFINTYLLPALQESRLNHIIAVRDMGNEYRKSMFADYKANRKPSEEEMQAVISQLQDKAFEFLKGLGIPVIDVEGVEADDVLAYLVKYLPGPKSIHTVDKDLIQLVSETCMVSLKGTPYTHYPIKNKDDIFQLNPRHVALYKSIVGDTSDNYGGVSGIGDAKFLKLWFDIQDDGLDELVAMVDRENFTELPGIAETMNDPVLRKLYDQRNEWSLGWKLASLNPGLVGQKIKANGKSKFRLPRWTKRVPDRKRVEDVLMSVGCPHMIDKLRDFLPTQTLITADNFKPDMLTRFKNQFARSPFVALDWETTDRVQHPAFKEVSNGREFVDVLSSTITGMGLTFGDNLQHTVYLSFDHADTNNLPRDVILDLLDAIPEGLDIAIQNVAFEIGVLKRNTGFSIANAVDTKVMASYVDENLPAGLKERSLAHLGYHQIKYSEVIEKGKTMSDYSAQHVFKYGADDPLVTAHLYDYYRTIMEIEGTWDFFRANENLPIEILADGFIAGVSMDWDELERQRQEDQATFDEKTARLRELIKTNQNTEAFESGVAILYGEWKEEAEIKARAKFDVEAIKRAQAGDPEYADESAIEDMRNRYVADALTKLETDIAYDVDYKDYKVIEEEQKFELTATNVAKVFNKLGIPELPNKDFLTKPKKGATETFQTWANGLEVSHEARFILDVIAQAIEHNKTSKKPDEGRNHPLYLHMQSVLSPMLDKKVRTEGFEMNLDSPKQMAVLLYGMLGLPIRLRQQEVSETRAALGIKTPAAQADKDAVATALAEDAPEISWKREALLCLRTAKECATRIKMFYTAYPLWKHPADGLIHPQINSCGTETRRPTGSAPNALQWPKRGDGVKFRRCILPNQKLGHDLIVAIDWKGQELRVAGALSRDPAFLDCYIGSDEAHALTDYIIDELGDEAIAEYLKTPVKDIHTQTASGILGKTYEETVADLESKDKDVQKKAKMARAAAKSVNFGSLYGIAKNKLSRQLICPVEDAQQFLSAKKSQYSVFEEWRNQTEKEVKDKGYVTTALGNRRHVYSDILSNDDKIVGGTVRQVVNYLIQGVCADNLKRTLTEIYHRNILPRTGAVLIAPIYDELVFSVHSSNAVELILSVHEVMTRDIPGLPVPMLADPSLGINFGDQIECGTFPTPESIQAAMDEAFGVNSQSQQEAA